jgi:hypothetical protein
MRKKHSIYLAVLLLLICIYSCEGILQKGKRRVVTARAKLAEKRSDLGDKIITRYDAYTPDTRFNKKRFQEVFGFEPTEDVKELYCHADKMGIDQDYQFSFNCDTATVTKITTTLKLTKVNQPDNYSSGLWHSFPWWDSTRITALHPYSKKGSHETYAYLWYDSTTSKAYYFMFDM